MFLKNTSEFQCGLRTKRETLTIYPGKAVHVLDVDVITINSKLVKITEEEYNALINERSTSQQQPDAQQAEQLQENSTDASTSQSQDVITEEQTEEQAEQQAEEQIEQQTEQPAEEQTEEQIEQQAEEQAEESTNVEQHQDNQTPDTLPRLEAELERLKTLWEQANRPKRKETLQKQIKAIQEKINKLK